MKLDGEVVFDRWDSKELLFKRLKSLFEGIFHFPILILLFSLLGEKEWLT